MIVRKYYGLCLIMILTLITCSPREVGPDSSPQDYDCPPPPTDVFTTVGVDLEFTQSTFGKVITGDFNIETDPQIIALASKAVTDDRLRNYLRCLAIHRDKYTNDQAAYFNLKSDFMATYPTTEQFLKWQKNNPYPKDNIGSPESKQIVIQRRVIKSKYSIEKNQRGQNYVLRVIMTQTPGIWDQSTEFQVIAKFSGPYKKASIVQGLPPVRLYVRVRENKEAGEYYFSTLTTPFPDSSIILEVISANEINLEKLKISPLANE
ncbi:hypothetical protein JYT44_02235 [Caldithrix abyssi]|nr:hypothetical protein [Caldithrix abyssi]